MGRSNFVSSLLREGLFMPKEMKNTIHVSLQINENLIEVDVSDNQDFFNQTEEILKCAGTLEMIDETLSIRNKYRDLFRVTDDGISFLYNIEDWNQYEKVVLILFLNHPFPSERSYIWKYGIESEALRKVIFNYKNLITSIDDKLIMLTTEGLNFIKEKLDNLIG